MGTTLTPLEIRVRRHKTKFYSLIKDKKIFIDITHNALGEICRVYYNIHKKKYEYEPIKR